MAEDAHEHGDDHEHGHDHGTLRFQGARVEDDVLTMLRDVHPDLARNLELSRDPAALTDETRDELVQLQRKVEGFHTWTPGFHSAGDRCAACGEATQKLWEDAYGEAALPHGAFVANVPVHPKRECIAAFAKANPTLSPQKVDRLRREFTTDRNRPNANVTQFFRHDVLAHPPFTLEDWANSVAEANAGKLDRNTTRDIERLLHWVHHRVFH